MEDIEFVEEYEGVKIYKFKSVYFYIGSGCVYYDITKLQIKINGNISYAKMVGKEHLKFSLDRTIDVSKLPIVEGSIKIDVLKAINIKYPVTKNLKSPDNYTKKEIEKRKIDWDVAREYVLNLYTLNLINYIIYRDC